VLLWPIYFFANSFRLTVRENPQAVNAISVGNINDAVNIYDG